LCAEEVTEVYQLSEADFALVTGSQKYICGNSMRPYCLCVECHDRYASEGRRTFSDLQRRCLRFKIHEDDKKNVASARLLAQAPDLLGSSEPLHELGIGCL